MCVCIYIYIYIYVSFKPIVLIHIVIILKTILIKSNNIIMMIITIIIMMIIIIIIIIIISQLHKIQAPRPQTPRRQTPDTCTGKRDSIHHLLLEVTSETAKLLELRHSLVFVCLYILCYLLFLGNNIQIPSGWWWW